MTNKLRTLSVFVRDGRGNDETWVTEDRISGRWKLPEEALKEIVPFNPIFAATRIEAGENHGTLWMVVPDNGDYRISAMTVHLNEISDRLKYEGEGNVKTIQFTNSSRTVFSGLQKQEAIDVVKGIVNNLRVQ